MKHKTYQAEKDFMDMRLSRIWYEFEDKSDSIQITIEKTCKRDDVYNITVSYIVKGDVE